MAAKDVGFLCDANKDWAGFLDAISRNTGKLNYDRWIDNARVNRKRERHWAADDLLDTGIGKTAVLIGAGPSIKKQVPKLRDLSRDPRFILIGVSSGLRFLLENGIRPHYCMVMEANPIIHKFFDGLEGTEGITLISGICVPPDILDTWKGEVKFLAIYTSLKEIDRKINKWYRPVNGCGIMFPAVCSQYNTAAIVAYKVFGCRTLIFVGNELSFATNDDKSRYYVDGRDVKDSWERKPHPDIYGNVVYTTHSFMALKMSLEDYLQRLYVESINLEGIVPRFFNATEAGIFGVSKRYGNLSVSDPEGNKYNVLWQLTLDMAVRQAINIMKCGRPITEESIIRPSLAQVYAYA
jgi:hypothetical protein